MKKTVRVDFTDFWPGFKKTDNYFYNILKKYYRVEITPKPDFLFCSCFSRRHFRYGDCVKILYMGENLVPDFNLYDYALGFQHMEFGDRYLRLPHYALYPEDVAAALHKHEKDDDYYLSRKKFCNRVVSNPEASGERERMFKALSRIGQVDSGGRYRNNIGGAVSDKVAFEREYRFTLAYENSSTPGYVTEKLLQAFAGETVPIYWGDPLVAEEFNPAAFINCMDYPDIRSVVRRVAEIRKDDALYLEMMKAPMVLPGSKGEQCLKEDYADAFLRQIFDREPAAAFRRNMVYAGKNYQKIQGEAALLSGVVDVVRKPLHMAKLVSVRHRSGGK